MRTIESMHDTVSAYAVADIIPDNFRRVTITHSVYADGYTQSAANAERTPLNAALVTMRLADGGYITVWPNGMVQVSDSNGANSINYQADTATRTLTLAASQPVPAEPDYDDASDNYYDEYYNPDYYDEY
jgi:hypothetical protein